MDPITMAAIGGLINVGAGVYGSIKEGRERRKMANERAKWAAENENLFNQEYYADYTQRADAQNIIRRMREEQDRARSIDEGKQVITGGTQEQVLAAQDNRNKAMSNVFSNMAAHHAQMKDGERNRYIGRKQALQGLEHDDMASVAQSAGNITSNAINALGSMDWATLLSTKDMSSRGKGALATKSEG